MKIAISTSGGDAPGLNAVIRGVTDSALRRGHTVAGIRNGFDGLLRDRKLVTLDTAAVRGIERQGGTILGAASAGSPFTPKGHELEAFVAALAEHDVDALVMVGGDGTLRIAEAVANAGVRVVAVPKTIDRDVPHTWTTFGFDSAVNKATEAIEDIHSTAASHERLMVIEVMGRDTGHIALHSGIAGGAHMIAIPEIPYRMDRFAETIRLREEAGERYHILVCAEGAHALGKEGVYDERTGRYGGVAEILASGLSEATGKDARALRLGHVLRGGAPTTFDRLLGLRFGSSAVSALERGESGVMISFRPPAFETVPIAEVAGQMFYVEPTAGELRTARNLGISFGD